MNRTLALLAEYLTRVHLHPSPFLLRPLKFPARAMTSDAVANRVMAAMATVGIQGAIFKPHSLRGAAATAMLAHGACKALTRQRGGWTTSSSFDNHCARLHQSVDWEVLLTQSVSLSARLPFLPQVFDLPP